MIGEFEKHRQIAKHDILGPPRFGVDAENQVLERGGRQRLQTGVDALRVSLEQGPLRGARPIDDGSCDRTQPMPPPLPVHIHNGLAEELGQLARSGTSQQVHLEETVLTVDKPGGSGNVEPVAAANGRDAVAIACDGDRRGQPRNSDLAVENREAADSSPVQCQRSGHKHKRQQAQEQRQSFRDC